MGGKLGRELQDSVREIAQRGETPLLGINSAPNHSVGFFCATQKGSAKQALSEALAGALVSMSLSRMRVDVNDVCVNRRVLNEALFCHETPAAASRCSSSRNERLGIRP